MMILSSRVCSCSLLRRLCRRLRPEHQAGCMRTTLLAISGSDIRDRFARGGSVRYLVPRAVLEFISGRALYRTDTKKLNGEARQARARRAEFHRLAAACRAAMNPNTIAGPMLMPAPE